MAFEANRDGSVNEGQSFTDFNEETELIGFIEQLGWNVSIQDRGNGGYYLLKLENNGHEYDAHIYLKKLTSGGRERYPSEKRYQFSGNVDRRGFDAPTDNHTIKAILCIYGNANYEERIICGWNIEEWGHNPGNAFNCLINIEAVANAFVFGMEKHISAKNQTSYAFKSAFLIYYLFNMGKLYAEPLEIEANLEEAQPALPLPNLPRNRILYGPPGSGKSYRIDEEYANGHAQIRVTFHPDSDYHSFVGSYKPVSDADGNIHYNFVPQAFTNAYLSAWSQPERAVFLIVEEINRGNCAQIFGDLFQCLDRNDNGYSVYPVDADTDLANYLKKEFKDNPEAAEQFARVVDSYKNVGRTDYQKLILPSNLFIYATMNTSDQSLFPMDSAFKRRWDWEYVPIDYVDANQFEIRLNDGQHYSWGDFIRAVNTKIYALIQSEDKQLGNRFVNPAEQLISQDVFKSKVMFYLWSELYKNETENPESLFVIQPDPAKTDTVAFTFSQLYEKDQNGAEKANTILPLFMKQLALTPIPNE